MSKIRATLEFEPKFWKRYVDDVFYIGRMKLEETRTRINTISQHIQFTMEAPVNGNMPFLDTMVTLDSDGRFSTGLYAKALHSGHILPWSSSVPMARKMSCVKSETQRALRNSTTRSAKIRSINILKEKFKGNGYPEKVINKLINVTHRPHRNLRAGDIQAKKLYVRIPFINEKQVSQTRRILS